MVSGGCLRVLVVESWLGGGVLLLLCRVEREGGEGRERKSLESLVQNEDKMKVFTIYTTFTWLQIQLERSKLSSLIKA